MSKVEVRVLDRAWIDLGNILQASVRAWGREHAYEYREKLNQALPTFQAYPEIGVPRPLLGAGIRTYRVEQHVFVYRYRAGDDFLEILRVLHYRQDIAVSVKEATPGDEL